MHACEVTRQLVRSCYKTISRKTVVVREEPQETEIASLRLAASRQVSTDEALTICTGNLFEYGASCTGTHER